MSYEIKRMDECCISISDGDHLPPPKSDDGIPFITISNIDPTNNTIDFSNTMYVPEVYYDALFDFRKAMPGDILYSVVGTFGVPVLIRREKKFVFQRHIAILRPNKDVVLPEYLYYVIKSGSFYAQADAFAIGSAQRTIGLSSLRKMKASIPSIEDQEKTVTVLAAYDNLIEVNNKRIKVLEQMAENLYKEWFVRFRFPGHEKAEFENGLPKGWRRRRISEFYTTSSGGTPSREHDEYYDDGTIPWIKTGELQDCLLIDTEEKITEVAVKKSSAKFFPKDSVLMAMYGVNIGMLAYSTMDATCNQACCVFRDKGSINTKHYLFQCLKSIRDYLLLISFGAAQQNLSQDLIKRVRIVMPDEETVIRFEQKIEPLYNEIKHLIKANACLIRQRDLLLPRLMSGKLEV